MSALRTVPPERIPAKIREVCRRLRDAHHEAYLVGGCVRDLLLGRSAKDWDVATSALPEQVREVFGRIIPTGIAHLTVTVLAGSGDEREGVEVTTYRGEGAYTDGRRPDAVRPVRTLAEDVARRDFTVNALALDPLAGAVVDHVGGLADLTARRLRAVGDPLTRFREDGLRPLRAVRFATVLGFALDPATEAAIPAARDVLRKVSAERIRDELVKMLQAPPPALPSVGLELLRTTGLLDDVLPELVATVGVRQNRFHAFDVWRHTLASVDAAPADPVLRMAVLLHDAGKPATASPRPEEPSENTFYRHEVIGAELADAALRRLRFSNDARSRVRRLVEQHMFYYEPEWTDATVRRFVRRVGADLLDDLYRLRAADVVGRGRGEDPETEIGALRARATRVLEESQALTVRDLAIDGDDVMRALGRPPGRLVGEVLRRLLERVIEEPALNERQRLLELVPPIAAAVEAAEEARR